MRFMRNFPPSKNQFKHVFFKFPGIITICVKVCDERFRNATFHVSKRTFGAIKTFATLHFNVWAMELTQFGALNDKFCSVIRKP